MKPNEELPFDYETILRMANSAAGKELIQLIRRQGGTQMEEAVQQAQNGDYAQAKSILSRILDNPEASRLMKTMEEGHE